MAKEEENEEKEDGDNCCGIEIRGEEGKDDE